MPSQGEVKRSTYLFTHVVLQPTTACNLNCAYCYLPDRNRSRRMTIEVAAAIAQSLETVPHLVTVLWHGGEPLACGLEKFRELLFPFHELRIAGRVQHSLQTNATLIDDGWCELFREERFRVGISVDGYERQNTSRVDWGGHTSYASAMRGTQALRRHALNFGVIAVVNQHNIDDPEGFYDFFLSLGCKQLNINVEEQEGLNRNSPSLMDAKVRQFWDRLFRQWRKKPQLRIREFDNVLGWMNTIAGTGFGNSVPRQPNLWPTVSASGDVVVVSPELMAAAPDEIKRFVVGNVLTKPLHEIVAASVGCGYVQEAISGFRRCRATCSYYSYCGGGEASNKYYELGTLDATETAHCRHTRKAVVDAVIEALAAELHESTLSQKEA